MNIGHSIINFFYREARIFKVTELSVAVFFEGGMGGGFFKEDFFDVGVSKRG